MPDTLRQGLERYLTSSQLAKLRSVRIGIAGAGGLGSNAAVFLARSGIEKFLIIDPDTVAPSNLNRQHYWPHQIGMPKVDALADNLRQLNSHIGVEIRQCRLEEATLSHVLTTADIWVEALDEAVLKKIFVESALNAGCKVVCASGIAGYGGRELKRKRLGNLIAIGDFQTSTTDAPPLAPRVIQAAAMMSDSVLEWVLGRHIPRTAD